MPTLFLVAVFIGPTLLLVLRIGTWVARALGYGENPRPGYLDLTTRAARRRARRETT
jgi:hypothetical protein